MTRERVDVYEGTFPPTPRSLSFDKSARGVIRGHIAGAAAAERILTK